MHRRRVLLAVFVPLALLASAGVAAATPDPGGPDTTATPTASAEAVVIGGRTFTCPAGFTCLHAHTVDGGPQVVGVFVVPDAPPAPANATTSTTTPPAAATAAQPTEHTQHAQHTNHHTRRAPRRQPTTTHTTTTRAPQPTRVAAAAPLPGAVDLNAAQRAAEACAAGYGCPLSKATGVVPAPGCTAAAARAPDGKCN